MAGVSLIAEATERSVGIVGAVASGAGESLKLPLEPATRLNAIAIEAASNVVAHAYPGSSGPLELEIITQREDAVEDLTVVMRDSGSGILSETTHRYPPGLGLTVIYALADEIEIRSAPESGTSIAATIQTNGMESERDGPSLDTDPRSGGVLTFFGTNFLEAVLPRTLAALVAGSTTALDVLTSVLHVGDAIAYGLRSCLDGTSTATIHWEGDAPREIRVGPLDRGTWGEMVAAVHAIEPRSKGWLDLEPSADAGGDFARIVLPAAMNPTG